MNPSEIKKVRKACEITSRILLKTIKELKKKKFKTELDVARFLINETYKTKDCLLAFKPIIAMGKNGAEIHHKPDETKLTEGFLVLDFGVKYKGYCADCTRTVYLGKPDKDEIGFYSLVLLAQETALNYVKPGVNAADIDLIARAALWNHYRHFIHSTGHGVGKNVHKSPRISPRSISLLKENHVIAVEPGIYYKNKLGIRIEDTVLIKKDKAEVLTKISKKLVVI
jgi:Xaa-Pro aminopeptidase